MRIPKIKGVIKRRLLINFRAKPEVIQPLLPFPFRPKLHAGWAMVGICLIRLDRIRPVAMPGFIGLSSENAAHRIAIEWDNVDGTVSEGVYIPRRDSSSLLNQLAGGRLFPGVHHRASFLVTDQAGGHIDLSMKSRDDQTAVRVRGSSSDQFPRTSCFTSLAEASAFFEAGSLGYSPSRDPRKSDGLTLHTDNWHVEALSVSEVTSSYFGDPIRFPRGSIHFDHALVMRNIPHEWHWAQDMDHPVKAP
jgi:hypothetical protein